MVWSWVRIRAGRQFTVSHSFTVDRRTVGCALSRRWRGKSASEGHHREMLNPERRVS